MSDSPIESTKELHESKERKPEMNEYEDEARRFYEMLRPADDATLLSNLADYIGVVAQNFMPTGSERAAKIAQTHRLRFLAALGEELGQIIADAKQGLAATDAYTAPRLAFQRILNRAEKLCDPRVALPRGAEPERTHELKTWPNYFAAIASHDKTFEARKNDRDFREGDVLTLREYDGFAGYSGRYATARISYVMNGATAGGTDFGVKDGYCILALRDVQVFPHD